MAKAKETQAEAPAVTVRVTLGTPRAHLQTSVGRILCGKTVDLPDAEASAAVSAGLVERVFDAPPTTDSSSDAAGDN